MNTLIKTSLTAILASFALCLSTAVAQTVTQNAISSGDFSDNINWDNGAPSGDSYNFRITGGRVMWLDTDSVTNVIVLNDPGTQALNSPYVNGGHLEIRNGSLTFGNRISIGSTGSITVGSGSGSEDSARLYGGTLHVTSGTFTLQQGGNFTLDSSAYGGTFAGALYIGTDAASLTRAANFNMSGGTLNVAAIRMGNNSSESLASAITHTANFSGGVAKVTGTVTLGQVGNTSTSLIVSGGDLTIGEALNSSSVANTTSSLTVSSGCLTIVDAARFAAAAVNTSATIHLSGGTTEFKDRVSMGTYGTTTMTIDGNAKVDFVTSNSTGEVLLGTNTRSGAVAQLNIGGNARVSFGGNGLRIGATAHLDPSSTVANAGAHASFSGNSVTTIREGGISLQATSNASVTISQNAKIIMTDTGTANLAGVIRIWGASQLVFNVEDSLFSGQIDMSASLGAISLQSSASVLYSDARIVVNLDGFTAPLDGDGTWTRLLILGADTNATKSGGRASDFVNDINFAELLQLDFGTSQGIDSASLDWVASTSVSGRYDLQLTINYTPIPEAAHYTTALALVSLISLIIYRRKRRG